MSEGSSSWYYAINGQKLGPVSDSQLKELALGGKLNNALLWKDGMSEWVQSNKIKGLVFPNSEAPSPSLPSFPDLTKKQNNLISKWCILILAGSIIWLTSTFMPWWGLIFSPISLTVSGKSEYETLKRYTQIIKENVDWYDSNIKDSLSSKLMKASVSNNDSKLIINIWGASTGTGIFTIIISLLSIIYFVLSFFLKILANWRWSFSLFLTVLSILFVVFDLLWIFGSPSDSAPPLLKQGISFGIYFHSIGTIAVLIGSIFDGTFGLIKFLKK